MQTLYFLALAGVAFAIVATLAEAIGALRRKPDWEIGHPAARALLTAVATTDRRAQDLPYVGAERRQADDSAQPAEAERLCA